MPRIPDDVRDAILADLRAGKSAGRAAKDHGVSQSSVSRIAKADGITLDRSSTKKATEAKAVDDKARVAQIQTRLLDTAEAALGQIAVRLDDLTADKAATVLGIALDKYRALQSGSDTRSLSDVDAWLDHMLDRR